jgi:hypothetical protein
MLALLAELRVPVAGSNSPAAHRALVDCTDPRLALLLAFDGAALVGLGIGVIDPRRFWKALALRNPALLAERIPALIKRRLRKQRTATTAPADIPSLDDVLTGPSGKSWSDSSPDIGNVTLILLHPSWRGRGESAAYIYALMEELGRRGATQVAARIARSNISSIRMCYAAGMAIEEDGAHVLATIDLPLQGMRA